MTEIKNILPYFVHFVRPSKSTVSANGEFWPLSLEITLSLWWNESFKVFFFLILIPEKPVPLADNVTYRLKSRANKRITRKINFVFSWGPRHRQYFDCFCTEPKPENPTFSLKHVPRNFWYDQVVKISASELWSQNSVMLTLALNWFVLLKIKALVLKCLQKKYY